MFMFLYLSKVYWESKDLYERVARCRQGVGSSKDVLCVWVSQASDPSQSAQTVESPIVPQLPRSQDTRHFGGKVFGAKSIISCLLSPVWARHSPLAQRAACTFGELSQRFRFCRRFRPGLGGEHQICQTGVCSKSVIKIF